MGCGEVEMNLEDINPRIKLLLDSIILKVKLRQTLEKSLRSRSCQRCEEPRRSVDFTNPFEICDTCYSKLLSDEVRYLEKIRVGRLK